MARYLQGQSTTAAALSANTTEFFVIQNSSNSGGRPTETDLQIARTIPGVYSYFNIRVSGNTVDTGNIVFTSRKNTANGNITATIAAGVSGFIQDLTNTDIVSYNDLYDFQVAAGGTTGTFSFVSALGFNAVSTVMENAVVGAMSLNAALTTNYIFATGQFAADATETNVQVKIRNAVIVQKMQMVVSINTKINNITFNSRKNTANGNLAITVTAGVTGIFTDLVNSDSLVATDLYNMVGASGVGIGNFTCTDIQTQWVYSSTTYDALSPSSVVGGITRAASGTQSFISPFGCISHNFNATEAVKQQVVASPLTLSKFTLNLLANTYSVSATARVRKNTANGNGVLTLTNGVTGVFEDLSNSDSFVTADLVTYGITGGTSGSITVNWGTAQIVDTSTGVVSVELWGAGGGGGANLDHLGGGGAGAYVMAILNPNSDLITTGSFAVTIGQGGQGGSTTVSGTGGSGYASGGNGSSGSTAQVRAGGGGGSTALALAVPLVAAGGGGGTRGADSGTGRAYPGASTSGGAGSLGGSAIGDANDINGAGGGGAGATNGTAGVVSTKQGQGGTGATITTTPGGFGAGGGSDSNGSGGGSSGGRSGPGNNGTVSDSGGAGGTGSGGASAGANGTGSDSGGGGSGGTSGNNGVSGGVPGGGGGSGGGTSGQTGGSGGNGKVIITYPTGLLTATGGTITTSGGNTIHTFTANGFWVVGSIPFKSLLGVGK